MAPALGNLRIVRWHGFVLVGSMWVCACGFDTSGATTDFGPPDDDESSATADDSLGDEGDESGAAPPQRSTDGPPSDADESTGDDGADGREPPPDCIVEPEICDGQDNDCDDAIDEWSADNPQGCEPCSARVEGDILYYVCSGETSWSAAAKACAALGTTLLTLSDPDEHDAIADALDRTELEHVWIGLNEHTIEDRWEWQVPQDEEFFEWDGGQPDDAAGDEDCGSLYVPTGKWHDTPCRNLDPESLWRVDGWVCEGALE